MPINTTRFFNHLMRRRVLIWTLTVLLILAFTTAAGAILWTVRMDATYQGEVMPLGDEVGTDLLTIVIPANRFQSIPEEEPVVVTFSGGSRLNGTVYSVITGPEKTKLKITIPEEPKETANASITLRSQRLIAAFLR